MDPGSDIKLCIRTSENPEPVKLHFSCLATLVHPLTASAKLRQQTVGAIGRHDAEESPVVREFSLIWGAIPSGNFMRTMCRNHLEFKLNRMGSKKMVHFVADVESG
jgi:hypothetical protein